MKRFRSKSALRAWIFLLHAKSLLLLSAACYVSLGIAVPYSLRECAGLALFARLARAAAPLVAILLLIPLPGALWRAWRERCLVHKLRSIDALRAMHWRASSRS